MIRIRRTVNRINRMMIEIRRMMNKIRIDDDQNEEKTMVVI